MEGGSGGKGEGWKGYGTEGGRVGMEKNVSRLSDYVRVRASVCPLLFRLVGPNTRSVNDVISCRTIQLKD